MRKEWPTRSLQSLCDDFKQDIVDGPFGSELQRKDYIAEGAPVLKIQNIKPFAVELKKMDYVSAAKFADLRRHSYRSGDIVMTKLGKPLGVCAIVEGLDEGLIVADLVRIRAQRVNTKYLCYHLNSQRTNDFINAQQKGTTRPRVTLSVVRELPILVPPLAEQQRIVGLLDAAFAGLSTAKANAERNLQNARALFEGHLHSVFTRKGEGWLDKRLGECFRLRSGDGLTSEAMRAGMYPVFGGNGIAGKHDEFNLSGDNVIIGRVGALCGNARHVTEKIWLTDNAFRIVDYSVVFDGAFLTYLLNFKNLRGFARQAAQPVISNSSLKDVPLVFPPLLEQKKLVAQFDALFVETQRLESLYHQILAALDALKKSLLHQAFSGAL